MSLKCKQGDLAIIIRSSAGNEGKIVTCVKFLGIDAWELPDKSIKCLPTWEIDLPLLTRAKTIVTRIPDEMLCPIRPGDMKDELESELDTEMMQYITGSRELTSQIIGSF